MGIIEVIKTKLANEETQDGKEGIMPNENKGAGDQGFAIVPEYRSESAINAAPKSPYSFALADPVGKPMTDPGWAAGEVEAMPAAGIMGATMADARIAEAALKALKGLEEQRECHQAMIAWCEKAEQVEADQQAALFEDWLLRLRAAKRRVAQLSGS